MPIRNTDDVLVVGAGPTGLLLAGQLARRGIGVRVIDRRDTPSGESRALGIHARALEMLDGLGLADEFVQRGRRVRAFTMWDGAHRLARIDFGALDSPYPFLLDLPQNDTELILRGYLARFGVSVEQSSELTRISGTPEHVEAVVRHEDGESEEVRTRYVVGCDGAHSTVRRQLGLPFTGHGYPNVWLLADVAVDWDRPEDEVHIIFSPAGRASVFMPISDGRWRVILYFTGERASADPPTFSDIAALVSQRVPGRVVVSEPSWLAAFRTHRRCAPAYRRGRVFLAGDAVHIHSPAGGQGMNTGLLDADNLAWKLAAVCAARAPAGLLDSYEAERAPVAGEILELSHRLVRLSSISRPWQRALRAAAVPVGVRFPGVAPRAASRISQLYTNYRRSPLTEPARRVTRRGPRPGDRAPDAALRLHGEATTLHRLLRDPRHTVLFLDDAPTDTARLRCHGPHVRLVRIAPPTGPGPAQAEGTDVATDTAGELRRAYHAAGSLHLIRPDGHLAATGIQPIDSYLTHVFGRPPVDSPAGWQGDSRGQHARACQDGA